MVYWSQKFLCQIMNFTQRVSMREHCWGQIMPYLNSIPSVYRIFRTIKRIFSPGKGALNTYVCSCTKQKTLSYTARCKLKVLNTVTAAERLFGPPKTKKWYVTARRMIQNYRNLRGVMFCYACCSVTGTGRRWRTGKQPTGRREFTCLQRSLYMKEESLSVSLTTSRYRRCKKSHGLSMSTGSGITRKVQDEKKIPQFRKHVNNARKKSCVEIEQVRQVCTNPGRQVARAATFYMVAPNICGSSVWDLFHVILLPPGILRRRLYFRKICAPLRHVLRTKLP